MKFSRSQTATFAFFALVVAAVSAAETPARFDGPAELPRVYLQSSVADTPAPGKTLAIKAGDDLQRALDQAACGDTLALEAGATFTGRFILRKKNCDDSHWIVIRTSAPDSDLPPEGSRLTPCYAAVSSLPGRPDFHCHSTKNVVAKLVCAGKAADGPIILASGANHYRLEALEITRSESEAAITDLVTPEARSPADHIVLDRVWLHGTAQGETRRGVYLTGTAYVSIVDSFFTDFHCVAVTGSCTDSQAIGGGGGDLPSGPYKIVNNFLEAAAENILFGGGAATITPADIEIRHNYLFKPLLWKPGQPAFIGGTSGKPFIVKNLFELKNAQRLLFEANLLDYSWGGTGQRGFAFVLTPRNQGGNLCPLCRVTDITLRYCKVRHMGSALSIADSPAGDGGLSTAGERYSIHDMLFEDIDATFYDGFGALAMLLSQGPQLRDVKIDHVTAFPSRVSIIVGAPRDQPLPSNFTFTNSIFTAAQMEINSSGGRQNCAFGMVQLGPAAVLKNCFTPLTFAHNAIISPNKPWPRENSFPKNQAAVGFVNYNQGKDGDYRLCKQKNQPPPCTEPSPYAHAASDGKDLGADIDAIETAIRGVE